MPNIFYTMAVTIGGRDGGGWRYKKSSCSVGEVAGDGIVSC